MLELPYNLLGSCTQEFAIRLKDAVAKSERLGPLCSFEVAANEFSKIDRWRRFGCFDNTRGGVLARSGARIMLVIRKQRGERFSVAASVLRRCLFFNKAEVSLLDELTVTASRVGVTLTKSLRWLPRLV